jgi:hypothetical protein
VERPSARVECTASDGREVGSVLAHTTKARQVQSTCLCKPTPAGKLPSATATCWSEKLCGATLDLAKPVLDPFPPVLPGMTAFAILVAEPSAAPQRDTQWAPGEPVGTRIERG